MSATEKISISLPADMVRMLRERVARGEVGSTSEAVREALRAWRAAEERAALERDALRRLWRDGLDSGPGRLEDIAAIKAEARARRARR